MPWTTGQSIRVRRTASDLPAASNSFYAHRATDLGGELGGGGLEMKRKATTATLIAAALLAASMFFGASASAQGKPVK